MYHKAHWIRGNLKSMNLETMMNKSPEKGVQVSKRNVAKKQNLAMQ